jgi:hypothetical protein
MKLKAVLVLFIWIIALPIMAESDKKEYVVTFYFAGTLNTAEQYKEVKDLSDKTVENFPRELLATLHYYQKGFDINDAKDKDKTIEDCSNSSSSSFKAMFDGVASSGDVRVAVTPNNNYGKQENRTYNVVKDEAISLLTKVLSYLESNNVDQNFEVTLNLVGYSRGGASAIKFSRDVESEKYINTVNIIALDPVAAELVLWPVAKSSPKNLEVGNKVKEIVILYAKDERTYGFNGSIPTVNNGNLTNFILRGSHETMVGLKQADGHSLMKHNKDDSNGSKAVEAVSWIANYIVQSYLKGLTNVEFHEDNTTVDGAILWDYNSSKLIEKIEDMNDTNAQETWKLMRETAYSIPALNSKEILKELCPVGYQLNPKYYGMCVIGNNLLNIIPSIHNCPSDVSNIKIYSRCMFNPNTGIYSPLSDINDGNIITIEDIKKAFQDINYREPLSKF